MKFLTQQAWRSDSAADDVGRVLELLTHYRDGGPNDLLLLPIAEVGGRAFPRGEASAALGALARAHGIYLAGAAPTEQDGVLSHWGFIFDPTGALVLEVVKTLPDLVTGFSDVDVALSAPRRFDVADTPIGKLAVLVGEDILSPHLTRMTVFAGADIILNPASERQDTFFEVRQTARGARAYENIVAVLCASPSSISRGSAGEERLPPASAVYDPVGPAIVQASSDETFLSAPIDAEQVRRRRTEVFGNFLCAVRTRLYAPGYKAETPAAHTRSQNRVEWVREGQRRVAAQQEKAASTVKDRIDRYDVVIGQFDLKGPEHIGQRDAVIDDNISRAIALTSGMARSPAVKLVVLPEFFMQGVLSVRNLEYWLELGVTMDGPEMQRLKDFAKSHDVFVSGQCWEVDPEWPERYFNTAFIIDDQGELIHRYRKIHCADSFGTLNDTTPGNIYSAYVERYGYEGLFPVADTKIGKLATLICFDMNFAETARAFVKRGAEVLIHPTSEPYNARRQGWEMGRRARAYENQAYVITSAAGGQYTRLDEPSPSPAKRGHSKIVRPDGRLDVIVDGSGHVPVIGAVDLVTLRTLRAQARSNLAIWDEASVYADAYAASECFPLDVWLETPMREPREGLVVAKKVMERFFETGVFVRPKSGAHIVQDLASVYNFQAAAEAGKKASND